MATSPLSSRGTSYATSAFLGVPNKRDRIGSGYLTPVFSRAQKRAEVLHNLLCSRGSPNKGAVSQLAASPLRSRGPKEGLKCYETPVFSRVPNKGDKIRSGCLNLAFSGAQKRVEVLQNPCVLGGPQTRGQGSEVVASPLPSRVPKRGRNCYQTCVFSGVPDKGDKIRSGCLNPVFLGAQKRAELLRNPL